MNFLERVLDPPRYGYVRNGVLYVPSRREILSEFFSRLNVVASRKNWLSFFSWFATLILAIPLSVFIFKYFSLKLLVAGFVYSMVILGSHGTFWLHRYGTHRAFKFRRSWMAMICRNLVMRIIPEEVYIVSHHVHHKFSELPGDPYNAHCGWLYCFLADVNHQAIRKDLTQEEYTRVCAMVRHTGVRVNSYSQYQKWGSLCNPAYTIGHYALNWALWFGVFYWIGGLALATALFGAAGVWGIGVRTFNFEGHGRGKDLRRDGIDFNRADLSVNQIWPGYVSGEWHNNHHLYPNGVRSGFLAYQLDLPWLFIFVLSKLGWVTGLRDYKAEFLRDHYLPSLAKTRASLGAPILPVLPIETAAVPEAGPAPFAGGA